MKSTKWMAVLVAGGLVFGSAVLTDPAIAQPAGEKKTDKTTEKHDDKDHKDHAGHNHEKSDKKATAGGEAKLGAAAPAFALTDTDGKTHNLSDYKGKVVVLEWFNPDCPFIVKHHAKNKTFNDLHQQYSSKDVVFLAVNSSANGMQGAGKEHNAKMKAEFAMPFPILMDESGATGRAYGAKTTPHVFVIDKAGNLAYRGAIDNNNHPEKAGDVNHVKKALDEVLAGSTVTTSETQPYGCSVKYAKK